jgi:predicted negative regulator of RcsB-dependent stress response
MASHLDLEEQEQLDQLKHFWKRYGNAITWLLIAVLGTFAAYNGWQLWQRKQGAEAAVMYDQLEAAAQASLDDDSASPSLGAARKRVQELFDDVLRLEVGFWSMAFGEAGEHVPTQPALS